MTDDQTVSSNFYTVRLCQTCQKEVKIDFLEALLSLDKPVFCEVHKKKEDNPVNLL
jgi:hypothetical protein